MFWSLQTLELTAPLVQVSLRYSEPTAYHQIISDGVYRTMREIFNTSGDDHFITFTEYDASTFSVSPMYFGIACGDDIIVIQIITNDARNREQRQVPYRRIVELLGEEPGIRPEDVFISPVGVPPENQPFSNDFAQYAQ